MFARGSDWSPSDTPDWQNVDRLALGMVTREIPKTVFLPTFKQLAYLVALYEAQHFGRAGTKMGVSQSTISASLVSLERLLGATLVTRTQRRVRFTDIGVDVAVRAKEILHAAENTFAFAIAS